MFELILFLENDACAVARNNIDKIQGVVKFVKRWLGSHEDNKQYLDQVKNYVNGELVQMRQFIGQLSKSLTIKIYSPFLYREKHFL